MSFIYYYLIFNVNIFIFKGQGYTQETDRDILLLDISNDNEYIWKTSFDIKSNNNNSIPTISSTPPQVTSSAVSLGPKDTEKANIIVGAIIGSIVGIAVALGIFFLYKRRKHIKKQDKNSSTPKNTKNDSPHLSENDNLHNNREHLLIPSSIIHQNDEKNEPLSEVVVSQNVQNDTTLLIPGNTRSSAAKQKRSKK